MPNSWFRLYGEFRNDPKIRTLTDSQQIQLVRLFCLRSDGPTEGLGELEIMYGIGCSEETFHETKKVFLSKGFITENWDLRNWPKRQFLSDCSTDRVRAFRKKNKVQKQEETFHETKKKQDVTPPETEQRQNRTEELELTLSSPEAISREKYDEFKDFSDLWNALRKGLPEIQKLTDSRRSKLRNRIRQGLTLDRFRQAVIACTQKPFLRGENDSGWTATFDWLISNDTNIEKAITRPYGPIGGNENGRKTREQLNNEKIEAALKKLDEQEAEAASGRAWNGAS